MSDLQTVAWLQLRNPSRHSQWFPLSYCNTTLFPSILKPTKAFSMQMDLLRSVYYFIDFQIFCVDTDSALH